MKRYDIYEVIALHRNREGMGFLIADEADAELARKDEEILSANSAMQSAGGTITEMKAKIAELMAMLKKGVTGTGGMLHDQQCARWRKDAKELINELKRDNMKHTIATSLTQVTQWMDAGLNVERLPINHIAGSSWLRVRDEICLNKYKYRLVEPEWEPEKGEEVYVTDIDGIRVFVTMWKGRYVCETRDSRQVSSWAEVKPIPPEKPVAIEGWADKTFICKDKPSDDDYIYVREILEGE